MIKIIGDKISSEKIFKDSLLNNEVLIVRMNNKASYHGERYGQDVEPNGFYCLLGNKYSDLSGTYSTLYSFKFKNPMIINWKDESDNIDWKRKLAIKYNSKGKKLANKIMKDGYDSIINIDNKNYPSEVVILNTMGLKNIKDINNIEK